MLCCLYKKRLPKKEKNSISPIDNPLYLTMYLSTTLLLELFLFTQLSLTTVLLTYFRRSSSSSILYIPSQYSSCIRTFFNLCLYQQQLSTRALQLVIVLYQAITKVLISHKMCTVCYTRILGHLPHFFAYNKKRGDKQIHGEDI